MQYKFLSHWSQQIIIFVVLAEPNTILFFWGLKLQGRVDEKVDRRVECDEGVGEVLQPQQPLRPFIQLSPVLWQEKSKIKVV